MAQKCNDLLTLQLLDTENGKLIGCAGAIALVAFLVCLIGSLFAAEATIIDRLLSAGVFAGIAFVATILLGSRDRARHAAIKRSVRQKLLERRDVDDAEYLAASQCPDVTLIAQTRQAVADFFEVPILKIHPTDDLRHDFALDVLEPGFHAFVAFHVFKAREVQPKPFAFRTSHLANIDDLANEFQRVLDCAKADGVDNDTQ